MRKLSVIFLAVMIAVFSVVPAFAMDFNAYEAPDFTGVREDYLARFPYVTLFVYDDGRNHLNLTTEPLYYDTVKKQAFPVSNGELVGCRYVYSHENDSWNYYASINGLTYVNSGPTWSNHDIYTEDGSLFLEGWKPPKPLAEEIMDLAGDTITTDTVPSVSSAMTILCVTGVGLLAMLVLLKLFGKRSLIHR